MFNLNIEKYDDFYKLYIKINNINVIKNINEYVILNKKELNQLKNWFKISLDSILNDKMLNKQHFDSLFSLEDNFEKFKNNHDHVLSWMLKHSLTFYSEYNVQLLPVIIFIRNNRYIKISILNETSKNFEYSGSLNVDIDEFEKVIKKFINEDI